MATANCKTRRNPIFLDEKYLGEEPIWDTDTALRYTQDEFDHYLRQSLRYYNYFYSPKDEKNNVVAWLKANTDLTKEQLSKYLSSADMLTPMTVCSLIKAFKVGMPVLAHFKEYIVSTVMEIVSAKEQTNEFNPVKPENPNAVSIYDRLIDKTNETIAEIDGHLDLVYFTAKPPAFNVYSYLTASAVPQNQINRIRRIYTAQYDELKLAQSRSDEQLSEAYTYLSKSDLKRVAGFYDALLKDLDAYAQVKKVERSAKIKKPMQKEKQVSKVKYLKESVELKLKSVSPTGIIGAKEVWLYNVRLRKLFKYVADDHSGTMGIQGTTIVGFHPSKSVGKTLRKPAEQLAALMSCGKIALRTFIEDIPTVSVVGSGRINEDCLILKVC